MKICWPNGGATNRKIIAKNNLNIDNLMQTCKPLKIFFSKTTQQNSETLYSNIPYI